MLTTAVLTGVVFRLVHRRPLLGWLNVHGYLFGLATVAAALAALGVVRATGAVDGTGAALVLAAATLLLGMEGKHLTRARQRSLNSTSGWVAPRCLTAVAAR